jgi:hypothetical protein
MPPKDIQPHELLFSADNGKTYQSMAHITDVPEMVAQPDNDVEVSSLEDMVIEGSFTLAWPGSISKKLLILTGKYPSNNWLKMHGYQMRRKRKIRKPRKPR